jgi:hexosaminidase
MKKHFTLFLIALLFLIPGSKAQISIIPKPNSLKYTSGQFSYAKGIDIKIIRGDEPTKLLFQQLTEFIKSRKIPVVQFSTTTINLNLLQASASDIPADGYTLTIAPNNITIASTGNTGLFYGMQSLFQVLKPDSVKTLPCVQITDQPAYAYRGFHLDVSRHFFGVDVIKQYLDVMAKLKLNQFHWHLTDDQGWRIEIKKYPKLTQVGACRKDQPACQFYTQEEIKQIVQYAKERYINIIPEIDVPGHSSAIVAAYPELGCYHQQIEVPVTFGIKENILCPSDSTFLFLKDVFDEVSALFPGKYIHIGGDETPIKPWEDSEAGKAFSAQKNISAKEFQSYFLQQIEQQLSAKGKKCIGWGEIMDGKVSKDITVMSWRGTSAGIKAAEQGNDAIMTPRQYCYFDYQQDWDDEKKAMYMIYLPLDKVYSFDPASGVKDDKIRQHILGGQACVWTEFITNAETLQYQVYPRIVAMAECLWTKKSNKNMRDFNQRLRSQKNYFIKERELPPIDLIHFKSKENKDNKQ